MDSNYTATVGKDRDKLPVFTDILLKNVRVLDGGKITLDGYDKTHRLSIQFDGVTLDKPEAAKITAVHAEIQLGPGATNFRPSGENVTFESTSAASFSGVPPSSGAR